MSASASLEMCGWVPQPVISLAWTLYADAVARPLGLLPEPFSAHTNAIRRAATDERMEKVLKLLYKRQGGIGRAGRFVHAARPEMVRTSPYFRGVEHISQQPDECDRVQDQAAAILFLVVTGNPVWDRRSDAGPRTQTFAVANQEAEILQELAAGHERDAIKYEQLGNCQAARTLRALAAHNRVDAKKRQPDPCNPWTVKRNSNRLGDDWNRGRIIDITQNCIILFGKKLLGTVTTLSNVALDRQDITKGMVQGVVKHLHLPSGRGPGG
jgi:hypothetical protein